MAFAIAAGRQPKFPTHQPITKSMYFRPRESVMMLPFVAATCSSAGSSLASGSRRRADMTDPFRARVRGDGANQRDGASRLRAESLPLSRKDEVRRWIRLPLRYHPSHE